jgi:DnaK suppressor protein
MQENEALLKKNADLNQCHNIMLLKKDKEKILESILKNIDKAKSDITEFANPTSSMAPENAMDMISRMAGTNGKSSKEAAPREARTKLLRLEHALTLIDKSEYGKCVRCGNIIPFARLLLMPESTKCALCP